MLQETSPQEIIPRDSATVVMLRDTAAGLEVFLMKRSGLSDTFGEAYVFPGGKLDDADCSATALAALDCEAAGLARALGEPQLPPTVAAGLYVAALRELFEEAGVLLSHGSTRPASNAASDWNAWLQTAAGQLQARAMQPWSRWITPRMAAMSKKRFDTRFFLTLAPIDQDARHDDFETTASVWLTPRDALQRWDRGEIEMAPPQIMSLAHLARYTNCVQALQAARTQAPPCICPENYRDDSGQVVLCYPGDPLHTVPQRALPGPTRLYVRNKRFEAEGGMAALYAD
ncbi:MAG: NUDIX hydrolase [Rhodoferax sp.]|nr:MAG: NUDIX hydrolase [Rhodoferax sp.]